MKPINYQRRKLLGMLSAAGIGLAGCDGEQSGSIPASGPTMGTPPIAEPPVNPLSVTARTVGVVATEPDGGDFGPDVIQRIKNSGATSTSLDESFDALEPNEIREVFATLIALANNKPVRILEMGYPSATTLGSSQQRQADFIVETFKAWDQVKTEIPHLEFFALHDFDPDLVDEFEIYYGLQDDRFAAYPGTLGLRTWGGTDKLAWPQFTTEMNKGITN